MLSLLFIFIFISFFFLPFGKLALSLFYRFTLRFVADTVGKGDKTTVGGKGDEVFALDATAAVDSVS